MEEYKILTPKFRQEIKQGFDSTIEELRECEPNALVIARIEGLKMWKRYIDSLPDGMPIPVRKLGIRNDSSIDKSNRISI